MRFIKIFGIHAAQSALDNTANKIRYVWLDEKQNSKLRLLAKQIQTLKISFENCSKKQLSAMSQGQNCQGIVVEIELPNIYSENALKQAIQKQTDTPFFLVLDQVQDPHNFGACLRTADATGVNGIIITKDNSSGITPAVCKVACGAAETIPVYQVTNLARILRWLKAQALWVIGTCGNAEQSIFVTDLTIPLVLVMGAEGKGIRRLTRQQCDHVVKLPMTGLVESLNVSVAAGIIMYEVFKQRIR